MQDPQPSPSTMPSFPMAMQHAVECMRHSEAMRSGDGGRGVGGPVERCEARGAERWSVESGAWSEPRAGDR